MATATLKQIKDSILHKEFAPVYLLTGEEPYYIDILSSEFENNVIDEAERDFNFDLIYGKDANASLLINLCRQYPLMAERRLVILKEAQMLDKHEWEKMEIYFANPQNSTVFVICNKNKTFDRKTENLILKQKGIVFKSDKIPDYKLNDWISRYIKDLGYTADEKAVSLLENYLGNNLQKISNELNKMLLNLGGASYISSEDISKFIGISKEYNVFELQRSLAVKDIFQCNVIIDYFSKNPKENPIQMILPVLFSFFVNLLAASQVYPRDERTMASALNIKPYTAKSYVSALKYYSTEKLFYIVNLF
ncbi:MAG: DNA polymerase III subunit delta, partial [Bacteroidales bacterium]|nr:DNA polymerase III subunit delta [Bacteroidales bacterium]